jgi:acetyl-CoA carboxylase carboxyltransferase component
VARGKLLPRDRVEMLLDPDTPFLESRRWPRWTCTTTTHPAPG